MFLTQSFSLVILALIFSWLAVLTILFYRLFHHYQKLTRGITKKDLQTVLNNLLNGLAKESSRIDELIKATGVLEKDGLCHVQKIGLVRFNPFAETGGDQSFSLAVLDQKDSGFIISSLHSRESTRLYAKAVTAGKAKGYQLSAEEKQAIKDARKIK